MLALFLTMFTLVSGHDCHIVHVVNVDDICYNGHVDHIFHVGHTGPVSLRVGLYVGMMEYETKYVRE